MKHRISTAFLGIAVATCALAGFRTQTPLSPQPLQAQTGCGAFDGLACASNCTRECSNGSCCSWSHYYYIKREIE